MFGWVVVVPTNRVESFKEFCDAWAELFDRHGVHFIVVEDGPVASPMSIDTDHTHLCWSDIPEFIPRKTDMIRSWGFYLAWERAQSAAQTEQRLLVLTLDDDVRPGELDPFVEYERRFDAGSVLSPYLSVGSLTTASVEMRGFPYKDRVLAPVAVQYGGWSGVLDYDAATQLASPRIREQFLPYTMPVPAGAAVTGSIMNAAFAVEYAPVMWQLTMLDGRYNRVGDIWGALFAKKALDAVGATMLINGHAAVKHERASDPYASLQKEAPAAWLNDVLWEHLPSPSASDLLVAYREVVAGAVEFFSRSDSEFADALARDFDSWLGCFG